MLGSRAVFKLQTPKAARAKCHFSIVIFQSSTFQKQVVDRQTDKQHQTYYLGLRSDQVYVPIESLLHSLFLRLNFSERSKKIRENILHREDELSLREMKVSSFMILFAT